MYFLYLIHFLVAIFNAITVWKPWKRALLDIIPYIYFFFLFAAKQGLLFSLLLRYFKIWCERFLEYKWWSEANLKQKRPVKNYALTTCELRCQNVFSSNQPTASVLVTLFCHIRSLNGKKDSSRIAIKINFWLYDITLRIYISKLRKSFQTLLKVVIRTRT